MLDLTDPNNILSYFENENMNSEDTRKKLHGRWKSDYDYSLTINKNQIFMAYTIVVWLVYPSML